MATGPEVMKNFFKVLKEYSYEENVTAGQSALDKATRAVSAVGSFRQEIIGFKMALLTDKIPEFAGLDSDTRLQKLTGMVLGADGDLTVDTGSISGSNAGGSVVKDAQSIVPETGDLSTAILPTEGSTTQIIYTGDDGKSFTFNVKWSDSFNKFVSGTAIDSTTDINDRLKDSRFLVDLNDFDEKEYFYNDDPIMMIQSTATYGDMKNAAPVILKGLNTYWLKESAKLVYDSGRLKNFDAFNNKAHVNYIVSFSVFSDFFDAINIRLVIVFAVFLEKQYIHSKATHTFKHLFVSGLLHFLLNFGKNFFFGSERYRSFRHISTGLTNLRQNFVIN